MNYLVILLTRKTLVCEEKKSKIWTIEVRKYSQQQKELVLLSKNCLEFILRTPNIFRGNQEPLWGHATRKQQDCRQGVRLGIGLILACFALFWPWGLLYYSYLVFFRCYQFFEFLDDIFFNMITVLQLVVLNQNHWGSVLYFVARKFYIARRVCRKDDR